MIHRYFVGIVMHAVITCTAQQIYPAIVNPVLISSAADELDGCPLDEEKDIANRNITNTVQKLLPNVVGQINGGIFVPDCGGVWFKVAHLDMSDPMQHCSCPSTLG